MQGEREGQGAGERSGEYGGDDGALEHERAELAPGQDPGILGLPTEAGRSPDPATGTDQAQRKQQSDLASGEENPV